MLLLPEISVYEGYSRSRHSFTSSSYPYSFRLQPLPSWLENIKEFGCMRCTVSLIPISAARLSTKAPLIPLAGARRQVSSANDLQGLGL